MRFPLLRVVATSLVPVLALALAACDPKLTGDSGGTDTDDSTPDPVVTPEALAVGNIVSFHTELLRAALSISAEFDSAAAGTLARGVFETQCWSLVEEDPIEPTWRLSVDGCVDAHGTTYSGSGELHAVNEQDGYTFFPLFDLDVIRAVNESNDNYNHDIDTGSFEVAFERSDTGTVTGLLVEKFLRHHVRSDAVTFSYANVHWSGDGHGAWAEWPDNGSTIRVVWDGVGLFDVEFGTGGNATFVLQSIAYAVDLDTGDVRVDTNP